MTQRAKMLRTFPKEIDDTVCVSGGENSIYKTHGNTFLKCKE